MLAAETAPLKVHEAVHYRASCMHQAPRGNERTIEILYTIQSGDGETV